MAAGKKFKQGRKQQEKTFKENLKIWAQEPFPLLRLWDLERMIYSQQGFIFRKNLEVGMQAESWWYRSRKTLTGVDFSLTNDLKIHNLNDSAIAIPGYPDWAYVHRLNQMGMDGHEAPAPEALSEILKGMLEPPAEKKAEGVAKKIVAKARGKKLSPAKDEANL